MGVQGGESVGEDSATSETESRNNVKVTGSDLSSDDDSDYETPQKLCKLDSEFVLDTLNRRGQAEIPGVSNCAFMGQTSQLQAFVDQINKTSKCATPGCNGILKPVTIDLVGLGGAVEIQYSCTGCVDRHVQFDSSTFHEASQQTVLSLTLQVAFVAAGCRYSQYKKVLAHSLGMYAVRPERFYETLKCMYPHVKSMVDEQCELAKEQMKLKPVAELGSFKNAVTIADGAWMTRGFHSQNFTFQIRNYVNGALLYYKHLCQRGHDDLCEGGYMRVRRSLERAKQLRFCLVGPRRRG